MNTDAISAVNVSNNWSLPLMGIDLPHAPHAVIKKPAGSCLPLLVVQAVPERTSVISFHQVALPQEVFPECDPPAAVGCGERIGGDHLP